MGGKGWKLAALALLRLIVLLEATRARMHRGRELPYQTSPPLVLLLSQSVLWHLFPHVHKPTLGCCGHLSPLEYHRRGIKRQLELEASILDLHGYTLGLP